MRTLCILAALALFTSPASFAQSAMPACDGDIAVVRVSTVKPGSLQGFLAAVAAHKEWYRSHGFKDNVIVASRVLSYDEKAGTAKYSDSEVLTYHVRAPSTKETKEKHDAAWDAYVKQYRDTSDIKSEYVTCMPRLTP